MARDNAYKPEEDDQPVFLTNRNQWLDTRPETFKVQLLGSYLKEKDQLASGMTFYSYWDCERELRQFFTFQDESSFVYSNNIAGLIKSMGYGMEIFYWLIPAMEWRLFIDSSSRSLKAVLHNGNSFSSIPIRHLVQMKETHNSMNYFLSTDNYHKHKWLICRDLKVVGLILRLQGGYKKYPCFLSYWKSQADDQHYVRQEWPLRVKT